MSTVKVSKRSSEVIKDKMDKYETVSDIVLTIKNQIEEHHIKDRKDFHKKKITIFDVDKYLEQDQTRLALSLLYINVFKKHFYSRIIRRNKDNRKISYINESSLTIEHMLNKYVEGTRNWWRSSEKYFFPNVGKEIKECMELIIEDEYGVRQDKRAVYTKKKHESRIKSDIIAFNCYFYDIDINTKEHPVRGEELDKQKAIISSLFQAYMLPTLIIYTRNGLQVFFAIDSKERETLTEIEWKRNEMRLFHFIQSKITKYVDTASTDSSHLFRVPNSLHKKLNDKDYYKNRVDFISNHMITTVEIESYYIVEEQKKISKSMHLDKLTNIASNDVIDAFRRKDFSFFEQYIEKNYSQLTFEQKKSYVMSYDLVYFLQINSIRNKSFKSIIREDNHASAWIDYVVRYRDGRKVCLYNDAGISRRNGEGCFCADIIELFVILTGMSSSEVAKILYQIFFSKKVKTIEECIEDKKYLSWFISDNIRIFKKYMKKNDKKINRIFNDRSFKLYTEILHMYKDYIKNIVKKKNKDSQYQQSNLQIGVKYISERLNEKYDYIKRMLIVFDYIGLIEKQKNKLAFRDNGKITVNYAKIKDITIIDKNGLLKKRIEGFNFVCPRESDVSGKILDMHKIEY